MQIKNIILSMAASAAIVNALPTAPVGPDMNSCIAESKAWLSSHRPEVDAPAVAKEACGYCIRNTIKICRIDEPIHWKGLSYTSKYCYVGELSYCKYKLFAGPEAVDPSVTKTEGEGPTPAELDQPALPIEAVKITQTAGDVNDVAPPVLAERGVTLTTEGDEFGTDSNVNGAIDNDVNIGNDSQGE